MRHRKPRLAAVGPFHLGHAIPLYQQKLALKFADQLRSSVGIVHLRSRSRGVCLSAAEFRTKNTELVKPTVCAARSGWWLDSILRALFLK
jgi:hypothetical protein